MKTPDLKRYFTSSIRNRLVLSFFLIGVMAVGSALVALFMMSESEQQTQQILTKTLPMVSGAQALGQEIVLFTAISRDLPKLTWRSQHQELKLLLKERINGIHWQLNDLESLGEGKGQLQLMREKIVFLEANLEQQNILVDEFLNAQERLAGSVFDLQRKHADFTSVIQPRIAHGYREFLQHGRDIQKEIRLALRTADVGDNHKELENSFRIGFETMVNTAIGEMRANHEIIAATFRSIGLMQEAANVDTIERVEELQGQFEGLLPVYRRLRLILANTTPENNGVLLTAIPIFQAGKELDSIFQLRMQELSARSEAARYSAEAIGLAEEFAKQVKTFTDEYRETAKRDSQTLERTIVRAQLIQFLVIILVVLVSVVIGWYYVGKRLVSRITTLKEAMNLHAMGRDAEIPLQGNDEITDMAYALRSFVNQRSTVENALRQSLDSLNEAQLIAKFGSCTWDKESVAWEWSDGFCRIIGYEPGEIESTEENFWAHVLLQDKEKVAQFFSQIKPSPRTFEKEFRLQRKDDTICTVATRWKYTKEEGQITNTLQGTLLDITERQQIEEELHKVKKLESIGVLAGGIAHDFNNLLTVIVGNISLARRKITDEHSAQQYLKLSENAATRSRDLTKRLLTFAKGGEPVRSMSDLQEILEESVEFALHGSNVKCVFNISETLWPVEVDVGQMGQVLQNLVVNADQSMPEGGTVSISCTNVSLKDDEILYLMPGNYVKIDIADEGSGIQKDDLKKIFDPYFTTKNKDSSKGSGLGLAIVHSIVHRHDGTVDVQSVAGQGTTFSVYIPALPTAVLVPAASSPKSITHPSGLVLVMDDEKMIRDVVDSMLTHLGYDVLLAADGKEAIEIYKELLADGHKPDIVIMDLTVPGGMGGEKAAEKLLEIDPAAKLIVSSGYSNDRVLEYYRDYGFCAIASKPYQLSELSEIVAETMILRLGLRSEKKRALSF